MLLVPELELLSFGGTQLFAKVKKAMDPQNSEPITFPLLPPHRCADDFKVVSPLKPTQHLQVSEVANRCS